LSCPTGSDWNGTNCVVPGPKPPVINNQTNPTNNNTTNTNNTTPTVPSGTVIGQVATCAAGSYLVNGACITCATGKTWNGSQCVWKLDIDN